MGFAAELSEWLNRVLAGYIGDTTSRLAGLLEPLVVALGILYTIVWGYLQLTGRLDEPMLAGVKRIITLAIILGAALQLWLYNEVLVDTFFRVPGDLASRIIGTFDQVQIVDGILFAGFDVAKQLMDRGSIFNDDIRFYLVGAGVYVIVFLTAVYTLFLLTLSRIALSVLLALGPLFIAFLLFDTTKKFFESWVAQLANYALITLLTILVAALMMTIVLKTADAAVAAGGNVGIADAARLATAAGLTFLVMRQVMSIAAGLASGLALSTFGLVSNAMRWGLGRSARGLGQFGRGLSDQQTTRWDSLSRKAGYYVKRGALGGARMAGGMRRNTLRRA